MQSINLIKTYAHGTRKDLVSEINSIASSSNNYKRMQSISLIETYACGTRKDLVSKKEEIKCNNIIK